MNAHISTGMKNYSNLNIRNGFHNLLGQTKIISTIVQFLDVKHHRKGVMLQ